MASFSSFSLANRGRDSSGAGWRHETS